MLKPGTLAKLPFGLLFWGANASLAVLFLILVLDGQDAPVIETRPVVESGRDLSAMRTGPQDDQGDIGNAYARPVFHSDRHGAARTEAPVIAQAAPDVTFQLMGILQVSRDRGWAFLKPDNGTETFQVAVGEDLQGWTLERLEADRAMITKGAESQILFVANDALADGNVQVRADHSDAKPRTRKRR